MNSHADLYLRQLPLGVMANFVYLIGSRSTRQCMVVDPAWDTDAILKAAAEDDMSVIGSLVTHYHPDHVGGSIMGFDVPGGVAELIGKVDAPIHVHRAEADGLKKITGVSENDMVRHEGGDQIKIGEVRIKLLHTPGHTPGSQCFCVHDNLITGDTLFIDGCGRVDLPGGDRNTLMTSLKKLSELPGKTVICPGHHYGPSVTATLSEQLQTNTALHSAASG